MSRPLSSSPVSLHAALPSLTRPHAATCCLLNQYLSLCLLWPQVLNSQWHPCAAHTGPRASLLVPSSCCAEELRGTVEGGIKTEGSCPEPVSVDCTGHTKKCGNRAVCGEMSHCSCFMLSAEAPGEQWFVTLRAWRC